MQPRGRRGSTREDEAFEGFQVFVPAVDGAFQTQVLFFDDAQRVRRLFAVHRGDAQIGPEIEEVVLNRVQELPFDDVRAIRREQTEYGVQFIDLAVGRHARVILGHAGAVAEAGFAGVAALGVNARQEDHG